MGAASAYVGRRERRKAETRERLLAVAALSFASRGYAGTTMDQVAEDADVARSTLFNYFPRKEDLLFSGVYEELRTRVRAKFREFGERDLDTRTTLREVMDTLAGWYDAQPQSRAALFRCVLEAGGPLNSFWYAAEPFFVDILRAGRRRGEISPRVDPVVVGQLITDVYLGALIRWSLDADRGSLAELMKPALDLCLDQLSPIEELRRP